jgi:hypothetical protein
MSLRINAKNTKYRKGRKESVSCLRGRLSKGAVERASSVTGGDAILEEAAAAERQADRLPILDRNLEGLQDFQTVVAELAVPVRPHARGVNGLAYRHRRLGVGEQRHAHWVRPPELCEETGRAGAGRTRCPRRREVEPHVFPVGQAAAVVLILERTRAAGHLDGDVQRLAAEIPGQTVLSGREQRGIDVGFEWE